jgi:hypothetical protein
MNESRGKGEREREREIRSFHGLEALNLVTDTESTGQHKCLKIQKEQGGRNSHKPPETLPRVRFKWRAVLTLVMRC